MLRERPGGRARVGLAIVVACVLAVALDAPPVGGLAFGAYRVDQRFNSITQATTTDSFASANSFGRAFHLQALTDLQTSFTNYVGDGTISWELEMLDLVDPSGATSGTFHIGVVNGTPVSSTNPYNGNSDLDWWYAPDAADLDGAGAPKYQLTATISSKNLAGSGPHIRLRSAFQQTWVLSSVVIAATTGSTSAPIAAASYQPPGFPASEHIYPAIVSFGSMSAGQLKGNISAASLAAAPLPSSFIGRCTQAYTTNNTMLDLLVGGCTTGLLLPLVTATQPDQVDPGAPAGGAGGPYQLVEDSSHAVVSCKDKSAASVTLATCLNAAAYSDYLQFTTDRVIGKDGQHTAFTSSPPAGAAPGGSYSATATGGGSGNPVVFSLNGSSTAGACTVSAAGLVVFTAAGTCAVDADQAGNGNYLVAATAVQAFRITTPRGAVAPATPATPAPRGTNPMPAASPPPRVPLPASAQPPPAAEWRTVQFMRMRI